MDINKLKEMNKVAIAVQGRYDILKIQKAMSKENNIEKDLKIAEDLKLKYTTDFDNQQDYFNIEYKEIRDKIFNDMKSKNIQAVGFVRRVGEDEHCAYYAAGLYDLNKAKEKNIADLEAVANGYGLVIAVVAQPLHMPNFMLERHIYESIINLAQNEEKFGIKPLAIRTYRNFIDKDDFEYDEMLWDIVESNLGKERVEYKATLGAIKPAVPRPYNQIGYKNESVEGKEK